MSPPHGFISQEQSDSNTFRSPPTNYDSINDEKVLQRNDRSGVTYPATTTTTESGKTQKENVNSGNNNHNREKPTNEYVLNIAFFSFVGFMLLQAVFAIIANSEAMLADTEAMGVDALTYLFNLWAERVKNRPPSEDELKLPLAVREHRVEMKRLYLELIPPLISVATLIAVTISTLQEAFETIYGTDPDNQEDVSAGLMLFFSGFNLLLDILNVTCFARAQQAYGLQTTNDNSFRYSQRDPEEATLLVSSQRDNNDDENDFANLRDSNMTMTDHTTHDSFFEKLFGNLNLNMCSAWTVSYQCCVILM